MKKMILLVLMLALMLAIASCGTSTTESSVVDAEAEQAVVDTAEATTPPQAQPKTATEYLEALQAEGCPITEIYTWTEETDINGLLGRPGQYISKADFMDANIDPDEVFEPVEENGLPGGTIEVFADEETCQARYDYLNEFTDASLGVFGLNQYMYKSDTAILRVSFDLTPSQAAQYEEAFIKIAE